MQQVEFELSWLAIVLWLKFCLCLHTIVCSPVRKKQKRIIRLNMEEPERKCYYMDLSALGGGGRPRQPSCQEVATL